MIEAASTSETSVNFYQSTKRRNPEDSHLYIRHYKSLKPHNELEVWRVKYVIIADVWCLSVSGS
jgi:hypothetical protein